MIDRVKIIIDFYNIVCEKKVDGIEQIPNNVLDVLNCLKYSELIKGIISHRLKNNIKCTQGIISNRYNIPEHRIKHYISIIKPA